MATHRPSKAPFLLSLFSISLVLFFLGLFVLLAVAGKLAIDQAKHDLEMKVMLQQGTRDAEAQKLKSLIANTAFAKTVRYVSPDDVMRTELKNLGDDFREAMAGANPFPASINLTLNPAYIHPDSVQSISDQLLARPEVMEVYYPMALIDAVDARVAGLRMAALLIGLVLVVITYFLILNTVRLAIHGRRLVIRTMSLIGATNSYIRWPFIRIGLLQGLVGGLVACGLLLALQLVFHYQFVDIYFVLVHPLVLGLYAALLFFGTLLGYLSSTLAVNRYLNKSLDHII